MISVPRDKPIVDGAGHRYDCGVHTTRLWMCLLCARVRRNQPRPLSTSLSTVYQLANKVDILLSSLVLQVQRSKNLDSRQTPGTVNEELVSTSNGQQCSPCSRTRQITPI